MKDGKGGGEGRGPVGNCSVRAGMQVNKPEIPRITRLNLYARLAQTTDTIDNAADSKAAAAGLNQVLAKGKVGSCNKGFQEEVCSGCQMTREKWKGGGGAAQ